MLGVLPRFDPWRDAEGCTFDPAAADRVCGFFEHVIRHPEGQFHAKPFTLERWQRAYLGNLFGWKREDGRRRFVESLLYLPRKNGKTTLVAGLSLYVLLCDGEPAAQDFVAAADREQAGLLFRAAVGMVRLEPELAGRVMIYEGIGQRQLAAPATSSFLKVLSADAGTKHGLNPHLVIVDELHAQPNRELWDVLRTGQASTARRQPLFIAITTADFDRVSICNEQREYAERVLDGTAADPGFLPCVFEAPPDADWKQEATWAIANPNLGVSVSLDYLRRECKRAQEQPAYENTFRRLHLNQRTQQDRRYLPLEAWDSCGAEPVTLEDFDGRDVWAGLDLAATTDTTAAVLVAFDQEGRLLVWSRTWLPAEGIEDRERRDRVPYLAFERAGLLRLTPGNVCDYEAVEAELLELDRRFRFRALGVDPWNSRQLTQQLAGKGVACVEVRQGFVTLNEPLKTLLRLTLGGRIRHGGNPLLRWQVGNLAVDTDAAGNVKPTKANARGRIDAVAALVTALAVANAGQSQSVYDEKGIAFLE